jgi:polysaccharide biosynthesis protein PslH
MRILFLTAHLPYPPFSGGRRREFELISRLSKTSEIHLCSITKSWDIDSMYINELRQYCKSVKLFEAVPPPNNLRQYSSYPHQMKRHVSSEAASYTSYLLKNQSFDIVHVEGYYLLQHVPTWCKTPIVLIEHNIEYQLALQRFEVAITQEQKNYFWSEYIKTMKWEHMTWKKATVCVTLTNEDKITIERLEPNIDVRMIPNGSDHKKELGDRIAVSSKNSERLVTSTTRRESPTILFVGNFAYEPNVDAALYFSREIFPLILKDVQNARLILVGNEPPQEIRSLTSNTQIEVTGQVPSLIPFYQNAEVVVCPLRIGGGVKVKMLEALGLGKAIVSTSVGAQGIDLSVNRAVAVADEAAEFAQKVSRLILSPEERRFQEQEALAYSVTLPSWDQVTRYYSQLYEEITDYKVSSSIKNDTKEYSKKVGY